MVDEISSLRVASARPTDFLAVAALDREAWRDYPHGEVLADGEHTWRVWCEHGVVILAWLGDAIAGAALAFPCDDGRFCVHKVMVDPRAQGRGVGKALMRELLDRLDARGVAAFLTVNPDNTRAVALYEAMGFSERVRVEGFYRPDEHRLILSRPARGTT